jgi:hypothetical protein
MMQKCLQASAICIVAAAILLAPSFRAMGQQRTFNSTAPGGVLRSWPIADNWQVNMIRLIDGALGCLLITGFSDQAAGEQYIWGMRMRDQSLALEILDRNERAVAGAVIEVWIDRVLFGTYRITRRLTGENGFHTILAELAQTDSQKLLYVLPVAGAIQLVTTNSTYSAPLQGVKQSWRGLQECLVEARHLGGAAGQR